MKRFKEFISLAEKAIAIYDSSASWETKYDLIFSPEVSGAIATTIHLSWYDPDTSYQEDVTAYISAVKVKSEEIQKGLGNII